MNDILYQKKVWRRGLADWCWRVRTDSRYEIARGVTTSRARANDAVRAAIEEHQAEVGANWRAVSQ